MTISTILSQGDTEAFSDDQVVDAGSVATLVLIGNGAIIVQAKRAGGYTSIGEIDSFRAAAQVGGPLTFRVMRRGEAGFSVGCSLETA